MEIVNHVDGEVVGRTILKLHFSFVREVKKQSRDVLGALGNELGDTLLYADLFSAFALQSVFKLVRISWTAIANAEPLL
ncbi:hypothetical protein D3C85_1455770 [compost metagenome]